MAETDNKAPPLARGKTFFLGALGTGLLCGLIALCVPSKPNVVAEDARPQRSDTTETTASVVTTDSQTAQTVELRGKELYERFCTGCHGDDGRAKTNFGRMMNPAPTNFYDGPWKGEQTPDAIIATVVQGKGAMPAYKKEITLDTDLKALADYVLSLRKEQQK